jgi:hypothetical protein
MQFTQAECRLRHLFGNSQQRQLLRREAALRQSEAIT